jgi:FMN phosphatase YigB (HAD superfamily)
VTRQAAASVRPPMPDIDAVFLDLGNVLAFHDDPVLFRRMSAWGGADPERIRERMLALWDSINRGTLAGDALREAVCRAAGSESPMAPEPFLELWNGHFRVHEAVLPMIEVLLDKTKVVLLSNTNEMHWRFVKPRIPLLDRFHDLVISYELRLAKPDPEIFRVALRRTGVRAENAVFFDDVPRFVAVANALGMHGRVFTDAPTFRNQLAELGLEV